MNIVVLLVSGVALVAVVLVVLAEGGRFRTDRSVRESVDDLWHENSTVYRELLWLGQQNQKLQQRIRELELAVDDRQLSADRDLAPLSAPGRWPGPAEESWRNEAC